MWLSIKSDELSGCCVVEFRLPVTSSNPRRRQASRDSRTRALSPAQIAAIQSDFLSDVSEHLQSFEELTYPLSWLYEHLKGGVANLWHEKGGKADEGGQGRELMCDAALVW